MGNSPLSISLAVGIAMLTTVGQACAQTAAQGRGQEQSPAPSAIGQAGAAAAPATPEAPAKAKRAAPKAAEPSGVEAYIANRPPVRREVPLTGRPVQSRPTATTPAAPAASGTAAAASANSAAAADASAAAAGRKMWPVVVPPAADGGAQSAAAATNGPAWSEAEIKEAKAHCTAVLKGVDVAMSPEDPIKQGECGSPVLFKVTSIGKGPAVEVSPPVLLTCDMISALDKWMKREVQPQARANLGGSIVKLETMSSYSCRNAYGRAKTRLSEHGKANAIDIAGFSTARDVTTVLAGWGPTQREQRAITTRLEAERAAQPPAPSSSASGSSPSGPPAPPKGQAAPQGGTARVIAAPPSAAGGAAPAPMPHIPGVIISNPSAVHGANSPFGFGPARLGGPKAPEQPPKPVPGDAASKQKFLRDIHASACKYFGTVLGPEANNAHRNHFHLDMAQRNRGNFCE